MSPDLEPGVDLAVLRRFNAQVTRLRQGLASKGLTVESAQSSGQFDPD